MKNYFPTLLPALALLTLGSCAGTAALSSTENDGVYYSSKDRTTQNARAVASTTQPAETASGDDITNPEYNGQRNGSSSAGSTEYYDDDYAYSSRIRRFHQPYYRGFGYGYNDFIYADPFWYGGPAFYSPWGPNFGFHDPFWGPSFYGGSFVNINIGFGNPYWGWGRPWRNGFGYGGGFYDGFYGNPYSGFYGGGFGYGGVNYYGVGGGVGTVRNVRYGPRTSRSAEATTAGRATTTGNINTGGRGRANQGGIVAPGGTNPTSLGRSNARAVDTAPASDVAAPTTRGGRGRIQDVGQAPAPTADQIMPDRQAAGTRYRSAQDAASEMSAPAPARVNEGRRWRVAQDVGSSEQSAPAPDYSQPRRSRSIFNADQNQSGSGESADQPVRRQERRSYEAPQRSYEAPQRTYEAPQRSYEQPSRSFEPSRSYSPPSGGDGSGGGSRGGGGGGGRGRGN